MYGYSIEDAVATAQSDAYLDYNGDAGFYSIVVY